MAVILMQPTQELISQFKSYPTWECSPAVLPTVFGEDEYFLWISGEAELHVDDGSIVKINPGDLVLCQKGTSLTWHIKTRVKKYYQIPVSI